MSAFVVSKNHIASVVRFATTDLNHYQQIALHEAEDWARRLMARNVESVNYRYPNHPPETAETITAQDILTARRLTPVEALKAISCLTYQSCELPTWTEVPEYRFLEGLTAAAIAALPGYDDAPWEIT